MVFESPFVVVVKAAQDEARRRGDRRLGTEHLFLGLLHDPETLQAIGVDLPTARAGLDALDRAALVAIGIDLGDVDARIVPARKRPPLTSNARSALNQAVRASRVKTRRRGATYLLLALLDLDRPDPVADLIGQLGLDASQIRSRIGK
jgi:ATP-dependent Clp protease ATP-binding subunit ClpA